MYFVAELCLSLCNLMACSPPGSWVHGDSPGKNTGVACCVLLQGIFPTQGLNPGLLHCRWILYYLSYYQPIPSLENIPDPGIKLRSSALQANSLPAELPGKPYHHQNNSNNGCLTCVMFKTA